LKPANPPPSTAPPKPPGLLERLKNYWNNGATPDDEMLANHPVLKALDQASDAYPQFTIGAIKNAIGGVGGLLKIVTDHVGNDGSPSDVLDYKTQHPQAGDAEATQAVEQGYRGQRSTAGNQHLKDAADYLMKNGEEHGVFQNLGGVGELVGELFSPLGLEEAPGEAAKGLSYADRMAQQLKTAKMLEGNPRIAKLVAIGARTVLHAAQNAGLTAAQTYVHTGGDAGAAANAGELAGVASPAVEGLAGAAAPIASKLTSRPAGEVAAEQGAAKYATTAQNAGRPALEAMNAAGGAPRIGWGIDEAGNFTEPTQAPVMPAHDVAALLNRTHDFTGVANAMQEANGNAYAWLDQVTGGKFRAVNDEVKAAQEAARGGGEDAQRAYQNALAKMQSVFDSAGGVNPEILNAVKQSWRQSYTLADIGRSLDQSLSGLPGDTGVSQTYRGINGSALDAKLKQVVRRNGLANVRAALGPGGLENLQEIANATKTNAARQRFNQAVHHVAEYLGAAVGYSVGASTGGHVGGALGAAGGAMAGRVSEVAVQRVLNAVRADPKIGQQLTFAIQSGARPENYAPLIGGLITKSQQPEAAAPEQ
jgi:hypothetical protein